MASQSVDSHVRAAMWQSGDHGLERHRSGRPGLERSLDGGSPFRDGLTIPAAPVLVLKEDQVAGVVDAGWPVAPR